MFEPATIAVAIFVVTYIFIATEWIHKTYAALAGGLVIVWVGILTQEDAFSFHVDWNTIFLLLGLMLIVNALRPTGIFEFSAYQVVRWAKGRPMHAVLGLCTLTAFLSPILDNVTTILLIAPVSIVVANRLKISPALVVILEIIASNIGGTATLIGDPPNIIIGTVADLGFMPFLVNLGPAVLLVYLAFLPTAWWILRRQGLSRAEPLILESADDPRHQLRDTKFLTEGLVILGLTVLGFIFHDTLNMQPATVAMTGAITMLVVCRRKPHEIFAEVHWTTLFFFVGLFVLVGGLIETGVVSNLADRLLEATGGRPAAMSLSILWGSAVASAFVDNIPYVKTTSEMLKEVAVTMNPEMAKDAALHAANVMPLWWSLALGSCLGGNATIIGASANVVGVGIVERAYGKITFFEFAKYGVLFTFEALVICSVYLWVRYFL